MLTNVEAAAGVSVRVSPSFATRNSPDCPPNSKNSLLPTFFPARKSKFSHGDALTAGSANTILNVPAGYDAIITYLFISNTTGRSKSIDARWVHNSEKTS